MFSSETEHWLTAYTWPSEPTRQALGMTTSGTNPQRVDVLDRLAAQLGFEEGKLGGAAYKMLDVLFETLDPEMERCPRDVQAIVDTSTRVFALEELLEVVPQFGWEGYTLDAGRVRVMDIDGLVRRFFVRKLTQRLSEAVTSWQQASVWPKPTSGGSNRPSQRSA